jgi:hypothetical protein
MHALLPAPQPRRAAPQPHLAGTAVPGAAAFLWVPANNGGGGGGAGLPAAKLPLPPGGARVSVDAGAAAAEGDAAEGGAAEAVHGAELRRPLLGDAGGGGSIPAVSAAAADANELIWMGELPGLPYAAGVVCGDAGAGEGSRGGGGRSGDREGGAGRGRRRVSFEGVVEMYDDDDTVGGTATTWVHSQWRRLDARWLQPLLGGSRAEPPPGEGEWRDGCEFQRSTAQHSTAQHSAAQHSTEGHGCTAARGTRLGGMAVQSAAVVLLLNHGAGLKFCLECNEVCDSDNDHGLVSRRNFPKPARDVGRRCRCRC